MQIPEQLELERRRRRRRRSPHDHGQKPKKHRTLLVSAIDEQAKVIHVSSYDLVYLPGRKSLFWIAKVYWTAILIID